MLVRLNIDCVRNLHRVRLDGLNRANVFYGSNGSGKTSVLESVHLLAVARSFRGSSVKSLIQHGKSACTVYGEIGNASNSAVLSQGVSRDLQGGIAMKIAGRSVTSVADLVENLPIQVINANSFDLLTGAPASRRRFLDWGVFHVEHRFLAEWQKFQRCIKQRNKLLRRGKIDKRELAVWTRDLEMTGTEVTRYRESYFADLIPYFQRSIEQLAPELPTIELQFRFGWDKTISYEEALSRSQSADREQGYTHVGPQRADIRVSCAGYPAADTLSRGQQKLVICALKLAQGQYLESYNGQCCAYLVDDLPAELDAVHNRLVCEQLSALEAQVFITCVSGSDVGEAWPEAAPPQMFHVEHGEIKAN